MIKHNFKKQIKGETLTYFLSMLHVALFYTSLLQAAPLTFQ